MDVIENLCLLLIVELEVHKFLEEEEGKQSKIVSADQQKHEDEEEKTPEVGGDEVPENPQQESSPD